MDSEDITKAEGVVSWYPPGSIVKIFYNPDDPEESVLKPGMGTLNYMKFAIGATLLFIVAICFFGLTDFFKADNMSE